MEKFLIGMKGKRVDVMCTGALSLRGEVERVEDGIVFLRDEDDNACYVALDKVIVVWEARDKEPRAGFLSGASASSLSSGKS